MTRGGAEQGEMVFQAVDRAGSEAQRREPYTFRELQMVWSGRNLEVGNAEERMDDS